MKFPHICIQSRIVLRADLRFLFFFFLRKYNFSVHGLVELAAWLSDSRILSYDASNLFTLWVCSTVYFNLFSFWSNHSRSPSGCNCHQYKFHRKMTLSDISHDFDAENCFLHRFWHASSLKDCVLQTQMSEIDWLIL